MCFNFGVVPGVVNYITSRVVYYILGSRSSFLISGPKFCKSLRQRIWGCALGLSSYDKNASENEFDALGPPESDDFFKKVWMKTAADNSSHFWDAFRNLPSNHVLSYLNIHEPSYAKWASEYQKTKTVPNSQKLEILQKTKGYLIMYQRKFNLYQCRPFSIGHFEIGHFDRPLL